MSANRSDQIFERIEKIADPRVAASKTRFFKTKQGQYGEYDKFIGVPAPSLRKLAIEFKDIPQRILIVLISSPFHEHRQLALFVLVLNFSRSAKETKKKIFNFYWNNKIYVNSWDLVDCSAPRIVGQWLLNRSKKMIYDMASSPNMWFRRIAIVSTIHFIRKNQYEDAISISKRLLDEREDLVQKALGWMLREVGKQNLEKLLEFLRLHHKTMPRTTLRYAVEHLPTTLHQNFMAK